MFEKLDNVIKGFNSKSLKQIKKEFNCEREIEGEWIRQFYIQGKKHWSLKWGEWEDRVKKVRKQSTTSQSPFLERDIVMFLQFSVCQ